MSRAREPATTKGMVQTSPLRMPVMVGLLVNASSLEKEFLFNKFVVSVT